MTAHEQSSGSAGASRAGTTSGSDATGSPGQVDKPTLRKAIGASALGNATEWFDYGVYAAVSVYITQHFFAEYGSIATAATFAVSFVLRPLGGVIWGPLGDKVGRRAVLALTILLMSGATFCIGLLPTERSVGVLAPVLLVLLRVVQGFSTGGEYGGAATFMAEYSPDRKRGFYGSFLEFGTIAGALAGTSIVLVLQEILSEQQMMDWGWRLPFFVALPLGLVGLYLRTRLDETPVFEEEKEAGNTEKSMWKDFTDLLTTYWPQLLTMFGMVVALNLTYYTLLTYEITYLDSVVKLDETKATQVMFVGQLAMLLVIPVFGALSDRVGRKPMWWASLVGLFIVAIPMFHLMSKGFAWSIVGFVVLCLMFVPQLSTISATFPAMFPTKVRYAGFAISYNIATAAFGGTASLVNEWMIGVTGLDIFPAFYMMAGCVVGFVSVYFLRETAGCSLRGEEIPGTDEKDPVAAVRA